VDLQGHEPLRGRALGEGERHGPAEAEAGVQGQETDGDKVLWQLVKDEEEDMATYYATRSEARDAEIWMGILGMSTTLMGASWRGYLEVVRSLLKRGAEVNKAGKYGQTPLYMASQKGHSEVVQALLGAEADVNKASDYGQTWRWCRLHCFGPP
jgi:hypothetical protein